MIGSERSVVQDILSEEGGLECRRSPYLVSYTTPDALVRAPVGDTMRLCLLLSIAVTACAADSRRVQPAAGGKNTWKPHKPLHIASELKSPQKQRGSRNTNFANQNSYGGPPEPSEPVDLHNKEFCVDVSTYQPVVWVEREAEECETVFVKQCSDRSENVCQDVTETKCEVRTRARAYYADQMEI